MIYYEINGLYYKEDDLNEAINGVLGNIFGNMTTKGFVSALRRLRFIQTAAVRRSVWNKATKICQEKNKGVEESSLDPNVQRFKQRKPGIFS